MKDYIQALKNVESQLKILKAELSVASKCTQKFLNECGKSGIKVVSIGKRTSRIPATESFPFGCSGSVFQDKGVRDRNGWPAIWGVVERLKISGGAGNSDQHQLNDNAKLCEGVYELKGKTWRKVE